ncbi:hypothetical protein OESDEN_22525 [Oesophagostomum dentatum]|uniref:Uncharacterized protein n=1 Tax=Oesophagostomum dentatum TaxID=61180 RepID=A0A0B1S3Q3_OESDE|nr:hypothetical protein OESDEN_22525 [Oesophagostomum dentatum]
MIDEAKTPFAAGLASTFVEGAEAAKKAATSAFEDLVDLANTVSETVVDGVKEAAEQVNDKMKAMQTRSSLVESGDGEDRPVKYEETDPIIDTVLESVATDSERVDHALNNVSAGMEAKENGKKEHEDDEGFRVAADSHETRLYLPPPSAGRTRGMQLVLCWSLICAKRERSRRGGGRDACCRNVVLKSLCNMQP